MKAVRIEFTSWYPFRRMPIYEYRCNGCNRKFSALVGVTAEPDDERCPHCGGKDASRLVSRFARLRTEDDRVDAITDDIELYGEPDSPTEVRSMMREMGKAMDDDMSDDMEEMFEGDMEGKLDDD